MKNSKGMWSQIPYDRASFISRMFFWWVLPLFREGYRRVLTLGDLSDLPNTEDSAAVWQRLDRCWQEELDQSENPSFSLALAKAFAVDAIFPMSLQLVIRIPEFLQPYLVFQIVLYFGPNATISRTRAIEYGCLLTCCGLVNLLAHPQAYFQFSRLVVRLKAAVTGVIYRKMIDLNSKALQQTDAGFIINLVSTDVEKLNEIDKAYHMVFFPLTTSVIFYLLHRQLGPMFLCGIAVCAIVIGISVIVANIYGKLRIAIGHSGDQRIAAMKEIILGMKLVKMFCWEEPLTQRIQHMRREETKFLTRASMLRGITFFLSSILGRLMIFTIFICAWLLGISLKSSTVIPTIGWLEIYRIYCRHAFMSLGDMLQLAQSLYRIEEFLMLSEEKSPALPDAAPRRQRPGDTSAIIVKEVYARWLTSEDMPEGNIIQVQNRRKEDSIDAGLWNPKNNTEPRYQVQNVSLRITAGELIVLTGSVGSGKSSLLLTVLGELPASRGDIHVCGDVGYAQQQPWVFHGTLRENIIMSLKFDEQRYYRVIHACGLIKDIEVMPHKDLSLVGERGLMLSGGQNARVSLARAIYKEASIYLLDDPLSAVDADVGKHIFQQCICGLLSGKTRILVTHQLQYLKAADRIAIIDRGMLTHIGTFDELVRQGTDYVIEHRMKQVEQQRLPGDNKSIEAMFEDSDERDYFPDKHNEEGSTTMQVYVEYLKAGYGFVLLPVSLLIGFAAVIFMFMSDWCLLKWTEERSEVFRSSTDGTPSRNDSAVRTNLSTENSDFAGESLTAPNSISAENSNVHTFYMLFFGCSVISFFLSNSALALMMSFASRNLHHKILPVIIAAKMRFFDSRPIGRILNRFSRDMGIIDSALRLKVWIVFLTGLPVVVFIGVTCFVNAWMMLALAPFVVSIFLVFHVAVQTTRQLNRIEAVARSPMFSCFTDTIAGLPSIRALKLRDDFISKFNQLQNVHSAGFFLRYAADRCYALICLVLLWIYFNMTIFASLARKEGVSGDLIGLSFVYLITAGNLFQYFMRSVGGLETEMTSVERVLSYTRLEPESPGTLTISAPSGWPPRGEIVFEDVNLRCYAEGPFVLRNINLRINAKEKIGVVGRTGAGKSSIVTLLFRLAEQTGEIRIDNIDVTKIGLRALREKLSVLPQDPILFAGSLRYNLDLFSEKSDDEIWEALREVNLKDMVQKLPDQLYTELSDGGNNFSVGERQLMCLARTILRHNRILILDEATANVDYRTDRIIQETVRRKFADCTVITVAHRLQTIMDSDRIMVLEDGEVREFDQPRRLLQGENVLFKRLVAQSGISTTVLEDMTKEWT